jgi:hypothetical protein
MMDMILLDWTRMGKSFCLAGGVAEDDRFRVVRPLLASDRHAPVRNVGWPHWSLEGPARWEIFELIDPEPAAPQPPHLEDLWVRAMRSRHRSAAPEVRQALLRATEGEQGQPVFGVPLDRTRSAMRLQPGLGRRSLATLVVPSDRVTFRAYHHEGGPQAEVRVLLDVPGPAGHWLPVKDHHLLLKAEQGATGTEDLIARLAAAIRGMGERVAVRLGLSRAHSIPGQELTWCWLMADGFFSLADPQP